MQDIGRCPASARKNALGYVAWSMGATVRFEAASSMTARPLPGIAPERLLEELRLEAITLTNLRSARGTEIDQFNAYLEWSANAVARLGLTLRPADLNRLITTRRYWILQAMDPSSRLLSLAGFVDLEVSERLRAFQEEHEELRGALDHWRSLRGELVCPDTNVYLHHERHFDEIDWENLVRPGADVHLVVPLLVIDELDRQKRSQRTAKVSGRDTEPVRTRARVTLRRIDRLLAPGQRAQIRPARGLTGGKVTAEILLDDPQHRRLTHADAELVDRAAEIQDLAGREMHIVTFDVGMKLRAEAAGLRVLLLEDQQGEPSNRSS